MFTLKPFSFLSSVSVLIVFASLNIYSSQLSADVISPNESADIQEPAGTYDTGAPSLVNMTAKTVISTGPCVVGDYTGCTLNDVLNDINTADNFKPEIKVHMTADNYPDDGLISNAELRQRGSTSREAPQKSFRIKLDKGLPLWRGERRIQLVKSFFDFSRIRNKLSYDLFTTIPHLPSMRTQFIKLFINDQNINENYGLYTQIEYFGKEYLERRGWDKDSPVYKAENFFYRDDPAFALDTAGKPIDLAAFEKIIEIKRGKNHTKFVEMIKALNNPALDFKTQVFDKYYNQDNYLSWLAVNILLGNSDTHFHNYYLYNPKGSNKFYLVPWDYDLSLGAILFNGEITYDDLPRWSLSHANWWGQVLHQKFLLQPGNLDLLKSAVLEIKNKYLSKQKLQQLADSYYDIVFPLVTTSPDFDYLYVPGNTDPERVASYNQIFNSLSSNVEQNYARFIQHIGDPMPFDLFDPVVVANDITFSWSQSVSLSGAQIAYDLEISTTPAFTAGTMVETIPSISGTSYQLRWTHPAGTYYYRILARNMNAPQKYWQIGYNQISTPNDDIYGVVKFTANAGSPSTAISNPVALAGISIDGNTSDWSSLTLFAKDPDDILNSNKEVIDWQNAGIAHDSKSVYMLYRNYSPVDPARATGDYIPWGWQTFLDTDNNPNTGFKITSKFGADYLLEGKEVLKYTGKGSGWKWKHTGTAKLAYKNNIVELGFPQSWLKNPQSMRVMYQGDNTAYKGTTLDLYPNSGYFSYKLGGVAPPINRAPVASDQNLSITKNSPASINLTASDADGDALSLVMTKQPTNGTLTTVGTGLSVQYTPNQNYIGSDSFQYKVNDGALDSNIATVSLNVIDTPPVNTVSNPVVIGGITVNGKLTDWNSLTLFSDDPDDITTKKSIDWQQAGIAHSSDTVYLLYQNRDKIEKKHTAGDLLQWNWQTYLDTDNSPATGYKLNSTLGADYILEGSHLLKYTGNGNNWKWLDVGTANTAYSGSVAELSFPRTLLGTHSTINVAFIGNNKPYDVKNTDVYPDSGSFTYFFGAGTFGKSTPVSPGQRGILTSPASHQPSLNEPTGTGSSGGGSLSWFTLSWLALLCSPLLVRRRKNGLGVNH